MVTEAPKKIAAVILGIISLTLTLTTVFSTLSAVALLGNPNNIRIGQFSGNATTGMALNVSINNQGYYDVNSLTLTVQLNLHNSTLDQTLLNKVVALGVFPAQQNHTATATFSPGDFSMPTQLIFPGTVNVTATVTIDVYYCFNLMHITSSFTSILDNPEAFIP
ncbi:MAG TPA: hypothetical protein VKK79_22220 [Candidatus Lokiarchaeia archaeon]|nr:hypothetical protein [Candidatus Lokiarchaeia archaeon]